MSDKLVFVVDDDVAVRNGLKFLLRSRGFCVEIFESARSFLETYDPVRSGCLLVDYQMPSMTGLALQRELNLRGWTIPVILITAHGTIPVTVDAMRAGAFDVIEKPIQDAGLFNSLEQAFAERDSARRDRVLRAQMETRLNSLTAREHEILACLAAGELSKSIARQLGISFRTVEGHRAHIARKLQARNPADLIRLASTISLARST